MRDAESSTSEEVRTLAGDLRAVSKLVVAATVAVTDVVEAMHHTIASGPSVLGHPLAGPARLVTGIVYREHPRRDAPRRRGHRPRSRSSRRCSARAAPGPEREAVLAALNGVLGDYLARPATRSPSR